MNPTHSCRRVAELLSQQLDEPLGWLDRVRLRMHLSMCSDCRNVEQQLLAVKALSADVFSLDPAPAADPARPLLPGSGLRAD